MMKVWQIIVIVVIISFAGVLAWGFIDAEHQESIRATERITYEGRVTAIQSTDGYTFVYLNSNAQYITVRSNNLELAVGKEYQIILDGNRNLVNAVILDEK